MEELILLVVLVVALLWIKNKFIEPEKSKKIDIFLSRGMAFVKRLFSKASGKAASIDKTSEIEKTDTHQVPGQQPIVDLKEGQVEMLQNINVSSIQSITNTADAYQKPADKIPEDSVLRRHYLTQLAVKRESITHPYPTDSVLRRHYESTFVFVNKPTNVNEPKIEPVIAKNLTQEKQQIPEDAILRRHFMTQLQAEIESNLFPRPTDSTLKRHYDNLVRASVAELLAG